MMCLRLMDETDLEMVIEWRNHPKVRSVMGNSEIITMEQHKQWYSSMSSNSHHLAMIFEYDKVPSGFVQLSQVDIDHGTYEWGFYLAPGISGIGKKMLKTVLEFAQSQQQIKSIAAKVYSDNEKSTYLHQYLGFTRCRLTYFPQHPKLLHYLITL